MHGILSWYYTYHLCLVLLDVQKSFIFYCEPRSVSSYASLFIFHTTLPISLFLKYSKTIPSAHSSSSSVLAAESINYTNNLATPKVNVCTQLRYCFSSCPAQAHDIVNSHVWRERLLYIVRVSQSTIANRQWWRKQWCCMSICTCVWVG